jgi:hypothetical protein
VAALGELQCLLSMTPRFDVRVDEHGAMIEYDVEPVIIVHAHTAVYEVAELREVVCVNEIDDFSLYVQSFGGRRLYEVIYAHTAVSHDIRPVVLMLLGVVLMYHVSYRAFDALALYRYR